jgi:formamidopyrimidine-DNA glycosylase
MGKRIVEAEIVPDEIVLSGVDPLLVQQSVQDRVVTEVGRKGKYWWIELDQRPWLFGHLGMAGWVRHLGQPTIRLREHGEAPLDDPNGRPRFLKMMLTAEDGNRIALTDGRRLARLWLGEGPESDPRVLALGPDTYEQLPSLAWYASIFAKRSAPIKALLLDQKLFSGVGNWIADEALYQAKISPKRLGSTLSEQEINRLLENLQEILEIAVRVGADATLYPEHWLFSRRWGGNRGPEVIDGHAIVREPVGGRTTAWVPTRQV